ncbi:hypothetical protein FM038_25850 [Shewanella eurypsychrophilus]|uniref:Uncharacterized protein n=1 Tax=Shewanella eurypsychrophilus TaxID=2593656 RepID=A0ABX8S6E5_9GAMM|nr:MULTISPECIES: hypothetical protein [Shewanella]QXP44869.1 hypothetical protein FM038_25850 [Shewanella eurypsychrophilus]
MTQYGILLSFTLYPAIGSLIVAAIMHWYQLDDRTVEKIRRQLNVQQHESSSHDRECSQ